MRPCPNSVSKANASRKYADAVELYATTNLSLGAIAKACAVSATGLSAHICRHHRQLLYARYGMPATGDEDVIKIRETKGQTIRAHKKYKEAIEACSDSAYIGYNVSQVARKFGLNPSALISQLRVHYPDVIPAREQLRRSMGIADNKHRGARPVSTAAYEEGMRLYGTTDMSIPEVAARCEVSVGGLSQFMRFYHKDIIACKSIRRADACGDRSNRVGQLCGNGRRFGPHDATKERFAPALQLYRTATVSMTDAAERTGVSASAFRRYLLKWHRDEAPRPRERQSATMKYAPAIASLRFKLRPVSVVAAEFGLNPDVFREYLRAHEPSLLCRRNKSSSDTQH